MKRKLQAIACRKAAALIQLALEVPETLRDPSLDDEDNAAIERALLLIRSGLLNDAVLLEQAAGSVQRYE